MIERVDLFSPILTFAWSAFVFVVSLWTRHTLLNIAPKARVNPVDSIQALAWQIAGYSHGAMNLPSIPNRNTDTKHAITPISIIVLHTGCDDIITLEGRILVFSNI